MNYFVSRFFSLSILSCSFLFSFQNNSINNVNGSSIEKSVIDGYPFILPSGEKTIAYYEFLKIIDYAHKYSNTKINFTKADLYKLNAYPDIHKINDFIFNIIYKLSYEFSNGVIDRETINQRIKKENPKLVIEFPPAKKIDKKMLRDVISNGELYSFFNSLLPTSINYLNLKVSLDSIYSNLDELKNWPFRGIKYLKKGDVDNEVKYAKHFFIARNEYLNEADPFFDEELEDAIKKYQRLHGLNQTGTLNKETRISMKTPISIIIKRIKTAMDMEKYKFPKDNDNYLIANIPAYDITYINNGVPIKKFRIIVGDQKHPTPIFKSKIKYVVINPSWRAPESILRNEYLNDIQHDLNFFKKFHIKVFDKKTHKEVLNPEYLNWDAYTPDSDYIPYSLVQLPWSKNALGLIKFIFPNKYSVYLHDTPNKSLFNKTTRALSHGCMRLDNPFKLYSLFQKENLLDNDFDVSSIQNDKDSVDNDDLNKTLYLKESVDIYIEYSPVFVDEDNNLNIRPDIYNLEKYFR